MFRKGIMDLYVVCSQSIKGMTMIYVRTFSQSNLKINFQHLNNDSPLAFPHLRILSVIYDGTRNLPGQFHKMFLTLSSFRKLKKNSSNYRVVRIQKYCRVSNPLNVMM